jgi:hypothetical protein
MYFGRRCKEVGSGRMALMLSHSSATIWSIGRRFSAQVEERRHDTTDEGSVILANLDL